MVGLKKIVFFAGILTIVLFVSGIWFGLNMQSARIDELTQEYSGIKTQWEDMLQSSEFVQLASGGDNCELIVEENMKIADRIYESALRAEDYNAQNEFGLSTGDIKYDTNLLRFQVWMNSIKIQQHCDADYVNVIYFYEDNAEGSTKFKQEKISFLLSELKEKYGKRILLLPIATNLNLKSIESARKFYSVKKSPAILIAEEFVEDGLDEEELDVVLSKQNPDE